ncbi:MAG TPA: beta-ketoacyl-[acyl-carrier-protein] synthase family protein [Candidatus Sulfotelmatobacter sp.]|nr:beta-ketoacyl-[acyl-carrier-protein] synthase family protein [Candidatus Sulfotelmatobacter sp.]
MTDSRKTIVVTGVGVVSPYGLGVDCLQAGMFSGKCCLAPTNDFYPGFVGSTAQVSGLPPLQNEFGFRYSRSDRLAMVAARDAVGNLDYESNALRGSGVFMASTVAGLSEIDPEIAENPSAWYQRGGLARAASYPPARVADAVGEYLGVRGPRCAISAACASSAMAIALAANMLLDGAAPMMLAGGSDALCPFTLSGFNSLQALDPDPCRPFDRNRKGLNLGEGAAVFVLETLERAEARNANVLAVLRGWAMTNDAFHSTAPQTEGNGLADCMRLAMEMAEVSGDNIGYVNAHGTGTPLNDVAETSAYETAFRERKRPIPVSSTKSYFGHCLGAAGALEAVIAIIAVRCGALLPTLRLADPIESPSVDWLRGKVLRQEVPLAMSVSAGFGGSNAALIFGNGQFGSGRG